MSTQLQTTPTNVPAKPSAQMQSILKMDAVQEQLQKTLGKKSGQFATSLLTLYTGDQSLSQCPANLVYAQALKAAQLDLPLDKQLGFAYVVPFYNGKTRQKEPQFIMGYKGYIQLAMRSGQYKTINADLVYEGELQGKSKLSGAINLDGDKKSDKVIGYFAHFELLNGFSKTLYMSVEEMAEYAIRYSPGIKKGTKPEDLMKLAGKESASGAVGWLGNFDDMAIKTCLRRLISKYGVLSVEMQNALIEDGTDDIQGDGTSREETIASYEVMDIDPDTSDKPDESDTSDAPALEAEPEF